MSRMAGTIGLAALVLSVVLAAGCSKRAGDAAGKPGTPAGQQLSQGKTPGDAAIAQKTCPVMGGPINKDLFVDYKGRRIYFCCSDCVAAFNKDPEKYVKKVDDELKARQP